MELRVRDNVNTSEIYQKVHQIRMELRVNDNRNTSDHMKISTINT